MKILLAIVISYVLTINIGYSNNLVQNGDFSNFSLGINNNHYITPSGTAIVANWQSATGYPWISETGGWDGNPGWVLPNPANYGSIFQSGINIINGRTYEISMYIKLQDPRPWPSPNEGSVSVKFSGDLTQTSVTIGSEISSTQWTKYTQTWTATDNFNAINLSATAWMNVDNVSISETQPPVTSLKMYTPFGKHGRDCLLNGGCCFNDAKVGSAPLNGDFGEFNTSVIKNSAGIPISLRMKFLSDPQPINGHIPVDENILLSAQTSNALGYKAVILRPGNYPVDYSTNPYGDITVGARFVSQGEVAAVSPFGRKKFVSTGNCWYIGGVCWREIFHISRHHFNMNVLLNVNNNGVFTARINTNGDNSSNTVKLAFLDDPQPTNGVLSIDTIVLSEEMSNELGYRSVILLGNDYNLDYTNYEFGEITIPAELIDPVSELNLTVIPEGLMTDNDKLSMNDTTIVYLRSEIFPYNIVDTATMIIDSLTFTGKCHFSSTGNYYIVIKHRNSIETWSLNPITITNSGTSYDFTTSSSQAFGNNLKLKGDRYCIFSGDVNQDGSVDLSDLSDINNASGNFSTGYLSTDLTGDGIVDLNDINIAHNNGSSFVRVIKP